MSDDFQKRMAKQRHVQLDLPSKSDVRAALRHLLSRDDARHFASLAAAELRRLTEQRRSKGDTRSDQERALHLALVKLLRQAGRLSFEEYLFLGMHAANDVHEDKLLAGGYRRQLGPISIRLRAIEKAAGLGEGEFWLRGDGPPEWQDLNRTYDARIDRLLERQMRSLKLKELADLFRDDRLSFDRAFEQGRRSMHHKDDTRNAVAQLVGQYEDDAKTSDEAGAHYAAMIMYGSACEARLLLRAIDASIEAEAARMRLPAKGRPGKDAKKWGLDDLIRVAVEAGWLSGLGPEAQPILAGWVRTLRLSRNLVHPGRHAVEHPHVAVGETQVRDARAIYAVICEALLDGTSGKRKPARRRPSGGERK